jgi:ATP-dependent DNA helicase DinG
MQPLVALDIETTGLDPQTDAVIEIGAVRFQGSRLDGEWSTLVQPGRPLSPFITDLTGITDDMLRNAPRLSRVLGDLHTFVGDLPVVGHSIGFDLSFLRPKGVLTDNQALDTYDLAAVVLPSAGRYRLSALAATLAVPIQGKHRALADAHTTFQIFIRLAERARELPPFILREIVRLGENLEWGGGWLFDEALRQIESEILLHEQVPDLEAKLFPSRPPAGGPLVAADEPHLLDADEIEAVLAPGGPLAKAHTEYEHRPQQLRMARAVSDALSAGRHLLVEAGTGTGKSMAYLVPAFAWAGQNGQRVVISTNTINLQDQLIRKDIPELRAALGVELRAAVLKGRSNYLCPRRLAALRRMGARTAEEMRVLAKVLVWMSAGGSGDRAEITLNTGGELAAWSRLSADNEACGAEGCLDEGRARCPYDRAHLAAESAHVVIVNHALLMADILTRNRVIPEYERLIIDEAHHLEAATTTGLSFHASEGDLQRALRDLVSPTGGYLGPVAALARRTMDRDDATRIREVIQAIADKSRLAADKTTSLFVTLRGFLESHREGEQAPAHTEQVRISPSTRSVPAWSPIDIAWDELRAPLGDVIQALTPLAETFAGLGGGAATAGGDLSLNLRTAARQLTELQVNLDQFFFEPDPQRIYWIEASAMYDRLSLHAAPLDIGPLVERHLWNTKESVILTSATLTAAGEFDYLKRRLHADAADELALGSPFDYETSTLLYLINDIPEPVERGPYQNAVERGLIQLCRAAHGRTLVLFTSHEQLRRTARALTDRLSEEGIVVLDQGEGSSRHALLEAFRSTEQAVLLGTRSFWEGVDVPGEALSVLAIVRLPFDVPTDPIVAARSEMFEFPFDEYSVPEAILRFRQGFGRLIRTRSDRGVVAVFDRRVLSKKYGRAFLDSLPVCTVRQGPLSDLPAQAARWLGS